MREEVNVSFDSNENEDTMRYIVQPTSIASAQQTLSDRLIHLDDRGENFNEILRSLFSAKWENRPTADVYEMWKESAICCDSSYFLFLL